MTTDAEFELRLRDWLTDAAPTTASARLRRRILDIPAAPEVALGWWHRIVSIPVVTAAVAVVAGVAVVLSGALFTMFDRAPGYDGGLCNNRQLQRALDELRDADGYRYVDTEQRQVLLSDPSTSLDDPVFGWTDALVSTVSYLEPDRTREVVTTAFDEASRGYLEQLRIDGRQWQLREIDGAPTWVADEPWPLGNWAWGYLQNAIGVLGAPGIASIRFGSEPVPNDLPGAGGCTIAAPGETSSRIVALRIGTDGRISHIYLGPSVDAPDSRDAYRNLLAIEYTLPDPGEFVAPLEFIDEEELYPEVSLAPEPSIGAITAPDDALQPIRVPVGDREPISAGMSEVLELGDGRWVAVGSAQYEEYELAALAWTSADAVTWNLVDAPAGFDGLWFAELAWDGETLVAIGYRTLPPGEDGLPGITVPESWLSTDGVTWRQGGQFDAGANPGRPVRTDGGWVAAGSIWSRVEPDPSDTDTPEFPTEVQRPAFFFSTDGATWETIEPEEAAYGSVGRPEVDRDGTIRAESCETPEPTNVAAGSPCFVREWTSTDGQTWTPGAAIEDPGDAELVPVPAGEGFLAVTIDASNGEPQLVGSDDGTAWEAIPMPAPNEWPQQLFEAPDGVLLTTGSTSSPITIISLWRSTDGGDTWDEIPLGVIEGSVGRDVSRVLATDAGLVIVGALQLDETTSVPVLWAEP